MLSTYDPLAALYVVNWDDGIESVVDRYIFVEVEIPPVVGALQATVTLLFPPVVVTDVTGPGGNPLDPPPKVPGVMEPVESNIRPLRLLPQP